MLLSSMYNHNIDGKQKKRIISLIALKASDSLPSIKIVCTKFALQASRRCKLLSWFFYSLQYNNYVWTRVKIYFNSEIFLQCQLRTENLNWYFLHSLPFINLLATRIENYQVFSSAYSRVHPSIYWDNVEENVEVQMVINFENQHSQSTNNILTAK